MYFHRHSGLAHAQKPERLCVWIVKKAETTKDLEKAVLYPD